MKRINLGESRGKGVAGRLRHSTIIVACLPNSEWTTGSQARCNCDIKVLDIQLQPELINPEDGLPSKCTLIGRSNLTRLPLIVSF